MVKKKKDIQYYQSVGRRKESVARVRLHIISDKEKTTTVDGKKLNQGDIVINDMPAVEYFPVVAEQKQMLRPFEITGSTGRFATTIKVLGGGKSGQLIAVTHGLSRALCTADETFRTALKSEGLLTRDPRVRERRKVGTGGKARRQKQSPKR